MEKYLRGTLELPGPEIDSVVENPKIVTFDTEVAGPGGDGRGQARRLPVLGAGRRGGDHDGAELQKLATPAYYSNKTGYVDKNSGLAVGPVRRARSNEIVPTCTRAAS